MWALLVALAVVAAACGGGDDGDGDGATRDTTGREADEGTPKPGGTLTMAFSADIENLNPLESSVNGRPFVADDVVATSTAIKERGFQRYMLENVDTIEATDDHTVVIRLSAPFAPLENFMANHHMWILPREGIEGQFDVSRNPVGTGPFMMTKREPNVVTEYTKNPDYFEEGKRYLDGVRMLVIPDQQARIAALRNGETGCAMPSARPSTARRWGTRSTTAATPQRPCRRRSASTCCPSGPSCRPTTPRRPRSCWPRQIIHDIQRYIMEEVANPVQTWSSPTRLPRLDFVRGYFPHASYGYSTLKEIWFDK